MARALSRRSLVIAALTGAGAAVLERAAPALSLIRPEIPEGVVFAESLPDMRGARAAGGWATSAVVRPGRRFDLVGVEWRAPPGARIELCFRPAGGSWSGWFAAALNHGHAPDVPSGERRMITEPVWAGGADELQLRSEARLRGVRLHFVNSTGTATALQWARTAFSAPLLPAALPLAQPILPAGPGQPRIIARSAWADRACRPRSAPGYGSVQLAFVHHTVNGNSYRRHDSAALVRAVCLFHRNVNGWDDIGYNFLVDRYGQIFEGRAGGIDEAVVGAQAGGYNLYSTGVGTLGDFASSPPPATALDALAHLLSWKLSLHGVPSTGQISVRVSRSGAPFSRYPAGAQVALNRISGHRDADSTECPGNALYARLPLLRRRSQRLAGDVASLSLSVPQPAAYPAVTATGQLGVLGGQPIAAATVELQSHGRKGERTVATAVTAPDGTWSAPVPVVHNILLRSLYRGDSSHPAAVSPTLALPVAPQLTLQATTSSVPPGGPVQFSGTVLPTKRHITLTVYLLRPDGSPSEPQRRQLAVIAGGFETSITFATPGHYRAVATTKADKTNAAGSSVALDVTVA